MSPGEIGFGPIPSSNVDKNVRYGIVSYEFQCTPIEFSEWLSNSSVYCEIMGFNQAESEKAKLKESIYKYISSGNFGVYLHGTIERKGGEFNVSVTVDDAGNNLLHVVASIFKQP